MRRQMQDNTHKTVRTYYIHGFASGKNSSTFGKIKERIYSAKALTYDSAKTYRENIKSLISQIARDESPCCLIGSSLGGFYAMQLTPFVHNCVVRLLINPCTAPKSALKKMPGVHTNFETKKTFSITSEICDSYPNDLDIAKLSRGIPTVVLLSKNDEVLDYRLAMEKFRHCADIEYIDGKHRLSDYPALFKALKKLGCTVSA